MHTYFAASHETNTKIPITWETPFYNWVAISKQIPSTPIYSSGNQCLTFVWDKSNEAEQQEVSMAMLVGKPLQCMQVKGRVGRTAPRKDQIGMPWLISAACLQAGPARDPPAGTPRGSQALPSCWHTSLSSSSLQCLFTLSTKAKVALGSLPTQQCGCSCPLSIPPVPQTCPQHPPQLRAAAAPPGSWSREILLADSIIGMTEVPLCRSTKTGWLC